MNQKNEQEIVGYCIYCKEPIYEDDAYVQKNGNMYHIDCWASMHNGLDEFGDPYDDEEE